MERSLIRYPVLIMLSVFSLSGASQSVRTPDVVTRFYNDMVRLERVSSDPQVAEIEMEMQKCFYMPEESGISLPNDFRFFKIDEPSTSHSLLILTSNNYIYKLSEYIYSKKYLKVKNEVATASREYSLPDQNNGKLSSGKAYVMTVVKKEYIAGNETRSYLDTVYTHGVLNRIMSIRNGNGSIANSRSIEDMKIEAARYYSVGDFSNAYKIFEEIIGIDTKDGDSYYRLALMTYYGQGCKRSRKKAKELIEWACRNLTVDNPVKEKAETVKRYWRYWNQ